MILDELVLHNFGLYAERQKVTLTPPSSDQPIILFGGLNGHGKTTLLDAIQLCLYGSAARISNRNGLSYREYLSRSLHRTSGVREAAVEIAFRHTIDGKEDRYRLHRSWTLGKSGCREYFQVLKNRRTDAALSENWLAEVEDLIPPNIASLFLFDGEQVEEYASQDNSRRLIHTAIRNLLGLDIVDQLDQDLHTYTRRKRTEDRSDPARDDIERAERELKDLHARASDLTQERAALRTTQIDPLRKKLVNVEEQFRNLGGDLFEQRTVIEREKADAEFAFGESTDRLTELASGELPMLLVRDLLNAVRTQDQKEVEVRREHDLARIIEDRDAALLDQLGDEAVDAHVVDVISAYLTRDRERRRATSGKHEPVVDLGREARIDLSALLGGELTALLRLLSRTQERRAVAEARMESARLKHSSIPGSDEVSELARERDRLRADIDRLEAQFASMGEELEKLSRESERCEQALSRIVEADVKAADRRHDRTRILRHAGRVRATLRRFRSAVIEQHVRRISDLVLESYLQLLRKASLISRLEIDPESFALTLYSKDGRSLGAERLSAGERQLLAIALLWGLAKASGRVLPAAIDTPLGRLDSDHRMHVVKRYFPFASHQVLLLSTDEEIAGSYLTELLPYVGRRYHLAYDDATGSTKIADGYFGELARA
ncbi:MAG: DNA sulfur modification protein DndD [Rhodospirillales bacterium]|nr:DNA sulfur modification protein DndD [Rhodospirillales bacterium]